MSPPSMQVARLHGLQDLRLEVLPRPAPGSTELLVAIEVCGVCATDARKFQIGVNDGHYPFNPGHEWVGHVTEVGPDVKGWQVGDPVFGDTYAGYAEYATISTESTDWSCGAMRLDSSLPPERGVFLEPLADCLHAVKDQARLKPGELVVVVGAGVMGLQIVAAAAREGGQVIVVEPLERRQHLACELGAQAAVSPEDWPAAVMEWSGGRGANVLVVAIASTTAIRAAMLAAAPGARIVAFAGFGTEPESLIDLNLLHYRELSIVGSEWIGTPPNQRRERYAESLALLESGEFALERLIDRRCPLENAGEALSNLGANGSVKTVIEMRGS
jgi:L-iditol 2-dehydrogenase